MDIDVTFFLQLGLVTLVIVVLRPILALPLLRVMDERHQQTHGARADIRRMERLTSLDKEAYQSRLSKARQEVHKQREAQRQAGRDRARTIEDTARQEAARGVLLQRRMLEEALKAAKEAQRPKMAARAQTIAGRLLGREVRL